MAIALAFSPSGCESGGSVFGSSGPFSNQIVRVCHAPVEHSLHVNEVRGFTGASSVDVWAFGNVPTSFKTYKFVTTWLMLIIAIGAFVAIAATKGNPFEWPD